MASESKHTNVSFEFNTTDASVELMASRQDDVSSPRSNSSSPKQNSTKSIFSIRRRSNYRRASQGSKQSLATIPNEIVGSIIDLYHHSVGAGDAPSRRLSIFSVRKASVLSTNMEVRRKGRDHRDSNYVPSEMQRWKFNLQELVTSTRENFWHSDEPDENIKTVQTAGTWLRIPSLNPWEGTLKEMEGQYGAAVMSFFSVVTDILTLHVLICLLTLIVIVPHYTLETWKDAERNDSAFDQVTNEENTVKTCTQLYKDEIDKMISESQWFELGIDIFTGTGIVEKKLFYGMFEPNYALSRGRPLESFDMSLALLTVSLACLLVSLLVILFRSTHYLSVSVASVGSKSATKYMTFVLSTWNHGLTDQKASRLQQSLYKTKLESLLIKEARKEKIASRSTGVKVTLTAIRVACNLMVVATLCGCGYAVHSVQNFSDNQLLVNAGLSYAEELFTSFLPSITVALLYAVAPLMFGIIIKFEHYSSEVRISVTLIRLALLRMASLLLLFVTFFSKSLTCSEDIIELRNTTTMTQQLDRVCGNCKALGDQTQTYCWETYIGQQLYKLVIVNFAVTLGSVFLIECPRKLIYTSLKNKVRLVAWMGQQEFDIPTQALDIVYTQTLCWLSILFCPFIPMMTLVTSIIFFYAKKFSLVRNQKLPSKLSSSSEVRVFFLLTLCLFLILSLIIVGICIEFLQPSQACGPFRTFSNNEHMIHAIPHALKDYPKVMIVLEIIMDMKFLLLVAALLGLFVYRNVALSSAANGLIELLNESKSRVMKDNKALWDKIHRVTSRIVEEDAEMNISSTQQAQTGCPGAGGFTRDSLLDDEHIPLSKPDDREGAESSSDEEYGVTTARGSEASDYISKTLGDLSLSNACSRLDRNKHP